MTQDQLSTAALYYDGAPHASIATDVELLAAPSLPFHVIVEECPLTVIGGRWPFA
jgi:hypothetical protein